LKNACKTVWSVRELGETGDAVEKLASGWRELKKEALEAWSQNRDLFNAEQVGGPFITSFGEA
jgi:hypothetical protein